MNTYGYVGGNPVIYVDPYGLFISLPGWVHDYEISFGLGGTLFGGVKGVSAHAGFTFSMSNGFGTYARGCFGVGAGIFAGGGVEGGARRLNDTQKNSECGKSTGRTIEVQAAKGAGVISGISYSDDGAGLSSAQGRLGYGGGTYVATMMCFSL